jgi:putative tricarboxylic transport membrane protein
MKINDAIVGLVLLALAVAVWVAVQGFPNIPGQNVGPALFPTLIAAGLAGSGLILVVGGLKARAEGWIGLASWTRSPRLLFRAFLVVAALLFYVLAAPVLGFFLSGTLILLILFAAFGARPLPGAAIAVLSTWLIQEAFVGLLRVPLPPGLFQPPLLW